METLKLKIIEVLVNDISIEEFEKWLYQSDLLNENLKQNSLIFEVITINYRKETALKELKNIASTLFDEKHLVAMKIKVNCRKIVNSNTPKNIEKYVFNIIKDFNFEIESTVYENFYSLYYSFNGFDYTNFTKGSLKDINFRTVTYAKTVLENLKNCKTIDDKKEVLFLDLLDKNQAIKHIKTLPKTRKSTLKQKLFAFLKKL
ncbi:hypothetical protein [Winogradskyella endarachnes]|uniref:Uncharacterized protein n=1 Tax=Winogradskyella endarachnes TaxID=2681965 RepID=A0A6L6UEC5_9FLAO|nr:hypothetical protein [Winogradskyella endarachnes]MUU79177.1 hypothetical protein [Winogradskyella endarachnes]